MHCNNFGLIGLVLFICVHSGKEKMGRDRSCKSQGDGANEKKQTAQKHLMRLMQKKRLLKTCAELLDKSSAEDKRKAATITSSQKQSDSSVASAAQCSSSVTKGYIKKEKTSVRKKMSILSSGEARTVAVPSAAKHSVEEPFNL